MFPVSEAYGWEVETLDHTVIRQYPGDGTETPSTKIPVGEVVRASIVPHLGAGPRHDVLLDHGRGEKFVKRFGRGFIKERPDGFKLEEYLQCIETTSYRFWVFSTSGRVLVTNPKFEMYL
jgi:hypothetical protein